MANFIITINDEVVDTYHNVKESEKKEYLRMAVDRWNATRDAAFIKASIIDYSKIVSYNHLIGLKDENKLSS